MILSLIAMSGGNVIHRMYEAYLAIKDKFLVREARYEAVST